MNDGILATLPDRLRLMRLGVGWTQQQLAHYSGIGMKSISSFENGSRTFAIKFTQLVDLATACGYEVHELLSQPMESFAAAGGAAVTRYLDEIESAPFRRIRHVRMALVPRRPANVKRGVETQVPSSSSLRSTLGWIAEEL